MSGFLVSSMFSGRLQKRKPTKKGRGILKTGLIVLALTTAVGSCAVLLFGLLLILSTHVLPQIHLNKIIYIPPDAHYYTETYYGGTSVGLVSIYYISNSNTDELQQWYKDFYPSFEADEHRLITAMAFDNEALSDDGNPIAPCSPHPFEVYQCVWIEMIDLNIDELPDLRSLNATLNSLPKTGTLIVYRYYIMDP